MRIQICVAQYKQLCTNFISSPRWNRKRKWVKAVWLFFSPSQITKSMQMSKHFTNSSLLRITSACLDLFPSLFPSCSQQLIYPQLWTHSLSEQDYLLPLLYKLKPCSWTHNLYSEMNHLLRAVSLHWLQWKPSMEIKISTL